MWHSEGIAKTKCGHQWRLLLIFVRNQRDAKEDSYLPICIPLGILCYTIIVCELQDCCLHFIIAIAHHGKCILKKTKSSCRHIHCPVSPWTNQHKPWEWIKAGDLGYLVLIIYHLPFINIYSSKWDGVKSNKLSKPRISGQSSTMKICSNLLIRVIPSPKFLHPEGLSRSRWVRSISVHQFQE